MIDPLIGMTCRLTRGKSKGCVVEVLHITKSHPLSSETRYGVSIISAGMYHTRSRIVNKSCLEVISK